jgi:hypothetical protein
MDTDDKASAARGTRNSSAVRALSKLDELGAIKLDVLLSRSKEIKEIVAAGGGGGGSSMALEEWEQICYPFYIRLGPRHEFDLVTVVNDLRELGFEVKNTRQF